MKKTDEQSLSNEERLKKAANQTDNPEHKRAIEERLKTVQKDKIVRK